MIRTGASRAVQLALALFLAGCGGLGLAGPPATTARLSGGVVLDTPDGYCVDRRIRHSGGDGAVAVVAACRNLPGGQDADPVAPVIMTVTVGPEGVTDLPDPDALAEVAQATLVSVQREDGLLLAQLDGAGGSSLPDAAGRHWRGAFRQGDRLVALALYAPDGSVHSGASGAVMLRAVADRIVTATAAAAAAE